MNRLAAKEGKKFIGYKLAILRDRPDKYGNRAVKQRVLIKLEIPADAQRVQPKDYKCRASHAKVLKIVTVRHASLKYDEKKEAIVRVMHPGGKSVSVAYSYFNNDFRYRVGRVVKPVEAFDADPYHECRSGIHFFLTSKEARQYRL